MIVKKTREVERPIQNDKVKERAVVVAQLVRAAASDTRGPRFESSHRQNLLNICLLPTILKRRK